MKTAIRRGWPWGVYPAGLKPCHRPLIAGLVEAKLIANYRLRSGNTLCEALRSFYARRCKPCPDIYASRVVRGDAGFGDAGLQETSDGRGLEVHFWGEADAEGAIALPPRRRNLASTEMPGLAVQEVELERPGRRLIVIRQRVKDCPQAGGKTLLEVAHTGFRRGSLICHPGWTP